MRYRVVKPFADPATYRIVRRGSEWSGSPEHAARLIKRGRIEALPETATRSRAERAVLPAPDIRHTGGGWYEVAGQRVRGREAAERLAQGG